MRVILLYNDGLIDSFDTIYDPDQQYAHAQLMTFVEEDEEIEGRFQCGICPAHEVGVVDTTGAGDAFFAGVAIGLTYGKTLAQSCVIGTRLSASVIVTEESVCPRFMPAEFGIEVVR
jgi:hypothetical protein